MQNFKALGLSAESLDVLAKRGFEEPTEIQARTIPLLLETEKNVIAQAQTGTGKTAAFGLPLIEKLKPSANVQAIILAPTRELVIQVCEEINALKGNRQLAIAPVYGGQSIDLQLRKLRRGVDIVVGTPGRILDHLRRRTLRLGDIRHVVLDEADEMLSMGFIEDIEAILEHTPAEKRVLLFSATMPPAIKRLAAKFMGDAEHIRTETQLTTHLTDQIYFEVAHRDKFEALCRIIDIESEFYGIVFCRTRVDVNRLASQLIDRGYAADGLHGDISQAQREKTLGLFRNRRLSILVATDVAARGIDVSHLTHVINFTIPQDPEAYIHRIGRTGRAGNEGTAITFITPAEFRKLGFIKRAANADIRRKEVPRIQDVVEAKMKRITADIEKIAAGKIGKQYRDLAHALLAKTTPDNVVAALLKFGFGQTLEESNYSPLSRASSERRGKTLVEEEGKTRLVIGWGAKTGTTKKKLLNFIVKVAGTAKSDIENIEIFKEHSFITVPFTEAEAVLRSLKEANVAGKRDESKQNFKKSGHRDSKRPPKPKR